LTQLFEKYKGGRFLGHSVCSAGPAGAWHAIY